jgi:hypothetical protein
MCVLVQKGTAAAGQDAGMPLADIVVVLNDDWLFARVVSVVGAAAMAHAAARTPICSSPELK